MAPKKRLRMRGVKQTPKRLEEEILERSNNLANDPGLLRPMCAGKCRKCAFDKSFKIIDSYSNYKDDADALIKFASRGADDLAKAYAGTISLSAAGKIPMLATATIAGEKVPYAIRGVVGNDKLIGCQYYTDPKLRLLYYNNFIKRNKLHLYSFDGGLVCSDSPNMPEDYLYDAFWQSPYEFKDDGLNCGHEGTLALEIKIKSLGETIRICESCAKDVSTIQFLISRLCAIDPLDDFEVTVSHKYHTASKSGTEKIEGDELKKYLRGQLNDRTLLQSIKKIKLGELKESEEATYIIGTANYGSDLDKFMSAVTGPENEKNTIRRFLTDNNASLVLKTGKTNEVITHLWDNYWKELLVAHTDIETANRYKEKPKQTANLVLDEAYGIFISADIVASLPEFRKPGRITRLADAFAKAAKINGVQQVVNTMNNEPLKDSKSRAVAGAFVKACDKNASLPIKLNADETDFMEFLTPFAEQLVGASGEKYREAMNTFLTATSSGESV